MNFDGLLQIIFMRCKPISPKTHALIDYGLTFSLLTVPSLLGFSRPVKKLYAIQGLLLMGYVALSKSPAAVKSVIPFKTHLKIDPLNVAQFALLTFTKPFQKDKKARLFNIAFAIVSGLVVGLTDPDGRTERISEREHGDPFGFEVL